MSIRARLADALRNSRRYDVPPAVIVEWANKTADVLLSLPDIAIVEKPLGYTALDRSCDDYYGMGT